jgi:uncharacterized protein (DUF1800 family)
MRRSPLLTDPARAWAAYEPNSGDPWDLPKVAHLHRRAGFSAPWAVLRRDAEDGPSASVDRLIAGEPKAADGTPADEFASLLDAMAARLGPSASLTRLQGIWLFRMIFSPHPLRERMTLFWHNHFATSNAKVNNTGLMQRQNDLLRSHALGSFETLLVAMGRDPAMLVWLDSTVNRKAKPNENYAREVMELFTLGRGRYTEKDIQEAARAFSGSFVVGDQYREVPAQHDEGDKTVLGRTGRFRGDDVARILLDQPVCAEFVCTKLYRHLVDEVEAPSPDLIAPLAEAFRASGHDVKVPVRMILRSRLFYAPEVRRRRVKGPVEFAVGTIRALEVLKPTVQADALAEACGRMGQNLFAPPSVAGWDGGPAWINTTTTLARANFALALLSTTDAAFGKRLNPKALADRHAGPADEEAARFYVDLLVQDAFDQEVRRRVKGDAREVATLVLSSPEYQLA